MVLGALARWTKTVAGKHPKVGKISGNRVTVGVKKKVVVCGDWHGYPRRVGDEAVDRNGWEDIVSQRKDSQHTVGEHQDMEKRSDQRIGHAEPLEKVADEMK